jgi:hypothetical protein
MVVRRLSQYRYRAGRLQTTRVESQGTIVSSGIPQSDRPTMGGGSSNARIMAISSCSGASGLLLEGPAIPSCAGLETEACLDGEPG